MMGRSDTDSNLGERKGDRRIDHHEITRGHDPDSSCANRTIDRRDHRRVGGAEPFDCPYEARRIDIADGALLQVCTGTENGRCVSEHDDPNFALLRLVERCVEVGDELLRQGVAVGRRIERDGGDSIHGCDADELRHDFGLYPSSS